MATEWKSQQADGKYYLQFETDNKEKYMLVEKAAQMAIDGKTTADYAEVKYGEWIDGKTLEKCSLCGKKGFSDWHYCPNCGAKMDRNNLSTIPTGSEGSDT
jgi:hypothetical protein